MSAARPVFACTCGVAWGSAEGPCVCEVPDHMRAPEPELCSYCLARPSTGITPDLDTICDECSDPLCNAPCPDDPTAGGCWLVKGHEGDHDIYGGTYIWPQTPDHMNRSE